MSFVFFRDNHVKHKIEMLLDTGLFEQVLVAFNYAIGISQQAIEHSLFGRDGNAGPIYVPVFTFVVMVINISLLYLDVKHKKMILNEQKKTYVVEKNIEGIYNIVLFDGSKYIWLETLRPNIEPHEISHIQKQLQLLKQKTKPEPPPTRLLPWWEVVFFLPLAVWRADQSWKVIIFMGLVFYGCSIGITQVNYNSIYYDLILYALQYSLICGLYGLIYKIEMPEQKIYWWQVVFWSWAWVVVVQWYAYSIVRHFNRHKLYKDKTILLRQ